MTKGVMQPRFHLSPGQSSHGINAFMSSLSTVAQPRFASRAGVAIGGDVERDAFLLEDVAIFFAAAARPSASFAANH